MARITEAALDEQELRRFRAAAGPAGDTRRLDSPRLDVVRSTTPPFASLALVVAGAGAVLAPGDVPYPVTVLGLAGVLLGGWLIGRGDRRSGQSGDALAQAVLGAAFAERREVIRAALAIPALRDRYVAPRGAEPTDDAAAGGESRAAGPAVPSPRSTRGLHAIAGAGAGDGETLDPAADAGEL